MHFVIIDGPNLNLTGTREPEVYGNSGIISYISHLREEFQDHIIDYFQSNVEGELINLLHEYGFKADGIVLNAGGYTHTSVALGDAVKAIATPVVEVHISNIFSREAFRHQSFISSGAKGVISGFGLRSYRLAIVAFLNKED